MFAKNNKYKTTFVKQSRRTKSFFAKKEHNNRKRIEMRLQKNKAIFQNKKKYKKLLQKTPNAKQ